MAKASDQEQQKANAAGKGGAAGSGSFGQLGSETGSKSSLAGDGGSKKEAWHEKKLERNRFQIVIGRRRREQERSV